MLHTRFTRAFRCVFRFVSDCNVSDISCVVFAQTAFFTKKQKALIYFHVIFQIIFASLYRTLVGNIARASVFICFFIVWRKRCTLWLDCVASVGNFCRWTCGLYSVHEQSSVFSWLVNIKYILLKIALMFLWGGIRGDEMNFVALDWPWLGEFVIFILWSRIDVNHHTCVAN